MKSFMWVITIIVLSTANLITATTEDNNATSNSRNARFSKGEIPLLIIRPVRRKSGSTQHFSRVPLAQSRVSFVNDDMSMLGSILPQLGFDPNLFSAFSMGGQNGGQSKKHLNPMNQNEISKYHSSSNYKLDTHKLFRETDIKPNYSFNFSPPSPPPQYTNIPKIAPLIASYSGHSEKLNQNERYLDQPLFIPTNNFPTEINDDSEQQFVSPLNIVNPPSSPHSYTTHSYNGPNIQSHNNNYHNKNNNVNYNNNNNNNNFNNNNNNNYNFEKYFEPKTIDFNLLKTKEELVIGKPTAQVNLHATTNTGYGTNGAIKENNFYIPKNENTASFEVKSKTDHVRFVPDYITKRLEKPVVQSSPGQNKNFSKSSFEQFKQTPKVEYFIPREQETAALKVSSDTEEYYKKFETDDYFLPKREPAYHKMTDVRDQFTKIPTTSTTEKPQNSEAPESYSFMINDDGYSDIHIQDHVYAEPEQLYYGYDTDSSEEDQSIENHYAPDSFYPSNHKEFESKMTALDFVQSSIKSNLNHLFDDYENKKPKLISSTYKKNDLTAQPELSFGPSIFSSTPSSPSSVPNTSYYFAKSKDDSDEPNTYYSTLKPFQSVSTTPKTVYVRPSFSLKSSDVRPVFESYSGEDDGEDKNNKNFENENKNRILPIKLYLKERNSVNEISTVFPKLTSTPARPSLPTMGAPVVSSTKFPIIFTTPKITTYKSQYSPKFRLTSTVAPHIMSSTTPKTFKIETTTEDSGVHLVSGVACERQCIRNTVSQEYDPVCGSDDKTYSNKGKLRCARTCGNSELHVKHYGGCGHK